MRAPASLRLTGLSITLLLACLALLAGPQRASAQSTPNPAFDAGQLSTSQLFTGVARYVIPIVVPPGTGGAEPQILVRYDTGTVDRRGNRDQAQPTGLGWTLDVGGYLFRDDKRTLSTDDDTFTLIFRGIRHTLVLVDSANRIYHTKDETFWRIQYQPSGSGDEWTLTTRTGMRYRFGETDNSRAYALNANGTGLITYKYLLSDHSTPNGPTVRYAYFKQSASAGGFTYDQAVYPDTITYTYPMPDSTTPVGSTTRQVKVLLEESRLDYTDQTSSAGQSFHERWLIRGLEITVGTALVRRYVLEYDYSIDRDPGYTWGGGATGDLTLKSVTEYGADGLSALPPLSFEYANARLSRVDNGIGGAMNFGYEQVRTRPLYRICGLRNVVSTNPSHPLYLHPSNCEWSPSLTPGGSQYDYTYLLGHILVAPPLGAVPLYKACASYSGGCKDWDVRTTPDQWGLSTLLGYGNPAAVPGTKALYSGLYCGYACVWGPHDGQGSWQSSTRLADIYVAPVDVYRVATRSVSDGRQGAATTTFQYEGLGLPGDGKDRGHRRVREIAPIGHYADTYFHLEEVLQGRPSRVQVFQQDGPVSGSEPLFHQTDYQWTPITNAAFPGATFAALSQVDQYTYEGDATAKQTRVVYSYDNFGNVTRTEHHGDVAVSGDERAIDLQYFPNENDWIISLPAYRAVRNGLDAGAGTLAASWFFYDQTSSYQTPPVVGNLRQREDWLEGGVNPRTSWTYDPYGNVVTRTNPRGYTTEVAYDVTQTFPRTVTTPPVGNPPAPLVTTYTYDPAFGVLLDVTDPNGRTTAYRYDAFGRQTAEVGPLGPRLQVSYDGFGTLGAQRITARLPDGSADGIWTEEYFDGLGRTFEVRRESGGPGPVVARIEYDSRGFVSQRSLPHFAGATVDWTTFTYDPVGRLTLRALPDGSTEGFAYDDWRTTITNQRGYQWTHVRDAYGRIVRVIEPGSPGPETQYVYDALGRLIRVTDTAGNIIAQVTYDTLSRRTQLVDADVGVWRYGYDENGNPRQRTDAKSQVITFEYDALDRLAMKAYPDGRRLVFTYDTEPDARGRLVSAEDLSPTGAVNGATRYAYDALGRVITTTRVIDGLWYTTRSTYTPFDETETLTFPDGEVLTYTYDLGGLVSRVVGAQDATSRTYVEAITYNAAGQPTQMRRYGGITTDRAYHPRRLWLDRVRSSTTLTTLQDLAYERDPGGNVTRISNYLDPAADQTFSYDPLDRLTTALGLYGTQTFSFDDLGNIRTKAGVTYTYGATAQTCNRLMPHAVTGTSDGVIYRYDCNGNLLDDVERTYVWDADDRPVAITRQGVGTVSFVYGPDGARVRKASPTRTVRYAGTFEDHVEENLTIKHIFAAGRRVATRVTGGSQPGVYVPLEDHLGSLHVLASGSQAVLGLSYLPFGETHRSTGAADWHQYRFTDQEHDPETGLYYYGARYYNPKLARFLSADSVVPDLLDPQSLNRYSYVLNNPLRYTDPTGLGECCSSDDEGARNEEGAYGEPNGYGGNAGDSIEGYVCAGGGCERVDLDARNRDARNRGRHGDMDAPYASVDPYGDPGEWYGDGPDQPSVADAQTVLTAIGLFPVIGDWADLASAALSALEGDWAGAALSAAAAAPIPGLSQVAGATKLGRGFARHHTIPKAIQKMLPPDVAKDRRVLGRPGLPNRKAIPEEVHKDIHRGPRGGLYNERFKDELSKLGREPTVEDVLDIRDRLVNEFGLTRYGGPPAP